MENDISNKSIGAAIEVHKILGGPGLLEEVYESCLCHELALVIVEVKATEKSHSVKNSVIRVVNGL